MVLKSFMGPLRSGKSLLIFLEGIKSATPPKSTCKLSLYARAAAGDGNLPACCSSLWEEFAHFFGRHQVRHSAQEHL
jgi:hypothetical protein